MVIGVDYHTGEVVWRSCLDYRPMGITHDGEGHLFISDHDNDRILMMTPDGKIHHTLLHHKNPASRFYHQAWIPDQRRLVVKDATYKIYLYDVSYE